MKAQRRHELHQNLLADWLAKQIEVVKPYTTWILGGVIALAAAAIVIQLISGASSSSSGVDWTNYFVATAITDSDERAKKLAELENSSASLWVHLSEAELRLEQATSKAYSDRDGSKKAVEEAKQHFKKVIEGAARQPMLLQRAQYGMAQACETADEFDKATEIYIALEKSAPESVYGKSATRRLKRLGSTDLKTFSTMLAAHKPVAPQKPRSPGLDGMGGMPGMGGFGGMGGLGGPGGMPDFGAPLPERPDLSLPGPSLDFPTTDKPEKSEAEKTDDSEKTPADPAKKPDDGEKKPAEPEKKGDASEKKGDEPEKKPAEPEKKPAEPEAKGDEPEKKPAEPQEKPEADKP